MTMENLNQHSEMLDTKVARTMTTFGIDYARQKLIYTEFMNTYISYFGLTI